MVQRTATVTRDCHGSEAPARPGGRALRGGACRALTPRKAHFMPNLSIYKSPMTWLLKPKTRRAPP